MKQCFRKLKQRNNRSTCHVVLAKTKKGFTKTRKEFSKTKFCAAKTKQAKTKIKKAGTMARL